MIPTSHREPSPASAKCTGRTIYSIESPIRHAAVISDRTMTRRVAPSFPTMFLFSPPPRSKNRHVSLT